MDENISAFAVLKEREKGIKEKKKIKLKKKKSVDPVSTPDIQELVSKKKKELLKDDNTSVLFSKKRKHDALDEKEDGLWVEFQNLNNPVKKAKKLKGPKSVFSNCIVTEKSDNIFLNKPAKKEKSGNKKFSFMSSTLKNDSSFSLQNSTPNGMAKGVKKKKPSKNKNLSGEPKLNVSADSKITEITAGETNGLPRSALSESGAKGKKNSGKIPKLIRADSIKAGENVFSWMMSPVSVEEFFSAVWEKKPLHIARNKKDFFRDVCSLKDFDSALKQHEMYFTKNIDVTSYVDGIRRTENPIGRARPSIVWDFYERGRSIRLLNPQTFVPNVSHLTAALQEFFRCFVGANIYLTPPGTQGFAPHYDDIEAFVLQLEGEKQWFLYDPRTSEEVLPRVSSPNFKPEEIGKPILEVTLKPGDLLYFPRGIIHQARCVPGKYSLHMTVSCYQRNSWADFFEKLIPVALERAIEEDVEFRKGLPIDFLDHLGLVHSDSNSEARQKILRKFDVLMEKLMEYCPVDAAADQLGREFMHAALPPSLSKSELMYGLERQDPVSKSTMLESLKAHSEKSLSIKLVRAHVLRLVSEENSLRVYYCTDNSKEYHAQDEIFFDVAEGWARGIDALIRTYPKFIDIKEIPITEEDASEEIDREDLAEFVYALWERGLILFNVPVSEI